MYMWNLKSNTKIPPKQRIKTELTDTENRLVVAKGEEGGGDGVVDKMSEGGEKVQTSIIK